MKVSGPYSSTTPDSASLSPSQEVAVVQLPSCIPLSATPWTAAHQASLHLTISQCSPKFMSIESVMPSNHLILCHPLLLPSISTSIKVFSNELALCIRWPKYWSFSFSISPSNEYSGLISFSIGWFDLLAVHGTLKSLLQHHTVWKPQFFGAQPSLWSSSHIHTVRRWDPTETSLTSGQHWTVCPGFCPSAMWTFILSMVSFIPELRSCPSLCFYLFSFWPMNSYITFSSTGIDKPSSESPYLGAPAVPCSSPVMPWSYATAAPCWIAVIHTSLQAQWGQILPPRPSLCIPGASYYTCTT